MSKLADVGLKFQGTFSILNGPKFKGQILSIPDTSRVSNFLSARRYLRTGSVTLVRPGMVVIINQLRYIVAEHGDGFFKDENIYKHFKLFEIDESVEWLGAQSLRDPVTGVNSTERTKKNGTVYLSTQPKSGIEDELLITHPMKTAICNVQLRVDDKVGGYVVTKSDKVLGVCLAELKLV